MSSNRTKTAISLLGYAEGVAEDLEYKVKLLKKELVEAQTKLVGARETIRNLREQVRIQAAQDVHEECSSREVEILAMVGVTASVGDVLTPEFKRSLRKAGAPSQ